MKRVAAIAFLLTLIFALPAFAGTTGVLRGCVSDSMTGRPLGGATVVAQSGAQVARTTTDATGHYVFVDLLPGTYTVSVELRHYDPVSVAEIPVQADRSVTVAIATHVELRTVIRDFVTRRDDLLRPGIAPDLYVVRLSFPARTTSDEMRFIPGVTAGTGSVTTH